MVLPIPGVIMLGVDWFWVLTLIRGEFEKIDFEAFWLNTIGGLKHRSFLSSLDFWISGVPFDAWTGLELVLSTVLSSFVTSASLGCFVLVGVLWVYLICWYLLTKLLFLITIASLSIPMFLSREWVISEFLLRSNSCSSVRFYCLWVR